MVAMIAFAGFVFGAIIGSFLNVLVMRHGALAVTGRSRCQSCGVHIRWHDNIPIFSWIILRGRCRDCGSRISMQYPIVEVLAASIFALLAIAESGTLYSMNYEAVPLFALHAALAALLIAIAVYDAKHTIIPDPWVFVACILALAASLISSSASLVLTLVSGPIAAFPLLALWLVSRGRWMGLGDAKLALAFGWLLGPLYGVFAVFFAFVIGAFVSVFLLLPLPYYMALLQKAGISRLSVAHESFTMRSEVAFGPYLIAALFIVWLCLLYNIPLPL